MAKDFELSAPGDKLAALIGEEIWIDEFLKNIFEDTSGKVYTDFCKSLASYHYDEGGSPEVHEFEIIRSHFNAEKLAGEFTCAFVVYFFFGCSGINSDKRDTITWKFKVDPQNEKIALTGEEPWVVE